MAVYTEDMSFYDRKGRLVSKKPNPVLKQRGKVADRGRDELLPHPANLHGSVSWVEGWVNEGVSADQRMLDPELRSASDLQRNRDTYDVRNEYGDDDLRKPGDSYLRSIGVHVTRYGDHFYDDGSVTVKSYDPAFNPDGGDESRRRDSIPTWFGRYGKER